MQSHKYQHKTKALRRQYEGNFLWDSVVLREKQWDSSARSSILLLYSDSAGALQLTVVMVTCMGGLCNSVCYLSIPSS